MENSVVYSMNAAKMERSKIRQTIINTKSEYDRIKGELSKGQGLAGHTV